MFWAQRMGKMVVNEHAEDWVRDVRIKEGVTEETDRAKDREKEMQTCMDCIPSQLKRWMYSELWAQADRWLFLDCREDGTNNFSKWVKWGTISKHVNHNYIAG